ncbi:MAG: type III polyketide synthase [Ignavibacteriaceae bacterium]
MIVDIQTASPPFKVLQSKASEELKKRMAGKPVISRLIEMASFQSGIDSRYVVIPDGDQNIVKKFYSVDGNYISPDTQTRMIEYEKWSKKLVSEAVKKIFEKNNFSPKNIERLITISCTGFFAPGLDYYLIEEFGIPANVKRANIGFMGCAASLIGFNSVLDAMNSGKESELNTLLVSVEICSLHLQTEPTRDNILSNMIFSDGAAAALFSNSKKENLKTKFELIYTDSFLFKNSVEFMGWKIGNFGFEMILSSELPKIIFKHAVPRIKATLEEKKIQPKNIKHWALHPGGRAILDSLQKGLGLRDEEMLPSRNILRNFGNMSSASILFVLKEIMQNSKIQKDDLCCAVAFGPGLTMETAILKGI